MRKTTPPKKTSAVLASLAVVLAAGAWQVVGANGRDDDRSRANLRVIGLTDDSRLVSFRATSPGNCTASAMAAASTRSIRKTPRRRSSTH